MTSFDVAPIDADGHILEPGDLWQRFLEPRYRPRAIRVCGDGARGEVLEIDGRPSRFMPVGELGFTGRMATSKKKPSYTADAPFGSRDPKERVALLDREGIDKAILYPTLSLIWEAEVEDPELAAAYARAYNRWIIEFCADSGGRLVPVAQITMGDPAAAEREVRRAVKDGAKGVFFVPYTSTWKSHAHPDYDGFWRAVVELGVPVGIHPTAEPPEKRVHQRFRDMQKWALWHFNVHASQGPLQTFTALFQYGLFERFPSVKVVVLESGAGWAGYLLHRMDAVAKTLFGKSLRAKELPSFYFRRQCWISGDPDEAAFGQVIEFVGNDRFFWASDFPHPDHSPEYMADLEKLVRPLAPQSRRRLLRDNVARVYGL